MPNLLGSPRALIATAVTAVLMLIGPAAGADAATWTVKGGGFGHGIGMNAYGSYGMAADGWSYKKILRHYYKGTRIQKMRKARTVRVLLKVDSGRALFSGAKKACGIKLTEKRTYGAKRKGSRVVLVRPNGKKLANCGKRLSTERDGAVVFKGLGRYRGGVEVVESGGNLNVINAVPVNDYVKGVIPNESIPSWPMDALRAQAVVARGIALTGRVNGDGFDLYNDTRSQVYGPISTEYARTSRAAKQTASEIVTYKGKAALTVFSASSGGHTENVENVWFGEPVPYLKGVKDPYDKVSPYHRWSYDFSGATLGSALGVKGRLKRVQITRYGVSKRVIWARVYGTGGVTKVRGDTLQYALGLPDRMVFSIKKKSARNLRSSSASVQSRPSTRELPGSGTVRPMIVPSAAPATTSDG
jgi:stage II sporulation protein D